MKFVLYTSVLNQDQYDALVVPDIIKTARTENNIHGITGVLLFDGENFTQYFEGEDAEVETLLDNIMRDPRHKNIVVVLSGELQSRVYDHWEMGYVDISNSEIDIQRCLSRPDFCIDLFREKVSHVDIE